ncbi:MAG TPA: ornithine carbamoyltransferase [Actinobacteria bacterium]|nr:ornithine carbamoyltransferase [bacterium BMS3Bbin01]HDH25764.1 ornithine carbamoyltransferase [Actinomycetota bacterium]
MDFLRIDDLKPDQLRAVLARAESVRRDPSAVAGRLTGRSVGLFFQKPSTRTRVSTELASAQLGAIPVVLGQQEVGFGSREAVKDVAAVLDRYLDVIAMRVFKHSDLVEVAEQAQAPVVNLLSDVEHPCQALADLQTIAEDRPMAGTTLAYVGDGNNVVHSLMVGAAMMEMKVRIATPVGYEPDPEYVAKAESFGDVLITNDAEEAVRGADVVYTDVWASMGQEAEAQERNRVFSPYRVDLALFDQAGEDAIFLHCLPAHRGSEVTDAVLDHDRSRVFDQAENRLHTFKALLLHLFE